MHTAYAISLQFFFFVICLNVVYFLEKKIVFAC